MHPAYLTFTHDNFFDRHTVTVKGEQDDNTDDERVTLTLSGTGVTTGTVIVEVDDDDLGLILSQTPVTVTEGRTADFNVALSRPPSSGDVTVVVSPDTDAVTVMPESLEFTSLNWDTQQQVNVMSELTVGDRSPLRPSTDELTVRGEPDDDTDETVMLTLSGTGVTTRMVTVEVSDNTIITRGPVVNLPGAPCDTQDNESSIEEERDALAQLYETAGGENWVNGDNWGDTSEPVDNWYGVMNEQCREGDGTYAWK